MKKFVSIDTCEILSVLDANKDYIHRAIDLAFAFDWDDSPMGPNYWSAQQGRLFDLKPLTPHAIKLLEQALQQEG